MSKAVLVMENMPDCCFECPICDTTDEVCPGNDWEDLKELFGPRPDWCPLVPLPERQKPLNKKGYRSGYIEGWNDAIEAMERE